MRMIRKPRSPNTQGRSTFARATAAACLLSAGLGGCSTPPPNAWVTAREYFGSARDPGTTDKVEVVGVGFTPNNPVVLRVADLPNYTQDIVYTVPVTPPADSYSGLDYFFTPPCLYSDGDVLLIERPVRLLATDVAGWTVYADTLTAQSFSCDSPPAAGH